MIISALNLSSAQKNNTTFKSDSPQQPIIPDKNLSQDKPKLKSFFRTENNCIVYYKTMGAIFFGGIGVLASMFITKRVKDLSLTKELLIAAFTGAISSIAGTVIGKATGKLYNRHYSYPNSNDTVNITKAPPTEVNN